jgi:hypothetical protein
MKIELERHSLCAAYILPNLCDCASSANGGVLRLFVEVAVNQRCAHLPVRLITGRIEDHTDPALRTEELAKVYRTFLENQRAVVQEWFGEEVAERLFQQVLAQISPGLRDALERYELV